MAGYAAEESKHGGVKIGAAAKKPMIAFVPGPNSKGFEGGKALSYSHLYSVDFALDYSELVVTFTGHRVRIEGKGLRAVRDGIEDFRCELVEEMDALQYAAADSGVRALHLEVLGEEEG